MRDKKASGILVTKIITGEWENEGEGNLAALTFPFLPLALPISYAAMHHTSEKIRSYHFLHSRPLQPLGLKRKKHTSSRPTMDYAAVLDVLSLLGYSPNSVPLLLCSLFFRS
ncbi:hypothetical protein VTP01DRAFT_3844, partial [Rhizomucor pusillus]|uniref:uncharacterized protein n=1 Tax=Rhizomucor pusillus TaxID=4840 RepID=UPI003742238E